MGHHFLWAAAALVLICGAQVSSATDIKSKSKAPAGYQFGDIMKPVDFVPRPRPAVQAPDPLSPEALADTTGSIGPSRSDVKKEQ